ncbi:MAG: GNAT family N-acetyltransferase [Anaerolineae bacterium]|nr:GNAT family N-acetyltransferase [Anaerolineae bacterium]
MSADSIILPDMPVIEGLRFRFICGEQDADTLYAVHAGRIAHDAVDPLSTFEDLPSRDDLCTSLSQAVAAGQQNQWLVAQVQDRVVGYSQIEHWSEDDGTWVYLILGWVLPEWRRQGIGTTMLHWCENTARHLAATQHPNEKFEFAANASSTEQDTTALLLHEGYYAGYTVLEMGWDTLAPLPVPILPAGIEVHPVLPEHYSLIAASVGAAYQNEYAENRFQETFDSMDYAARLSAPKHDPTLWQVAWDGDQVVGQVLSLIENGQAEVFEVSVRPAWRRHKLARALLSRAMRCLHERGVEVVRLYTVAEFRTRASDLYRSVGFRVLKEFPRYRKSPA